MPTAASGAARVFLKNPLVRAGVILSVLLISFSLIGPVLPLPDPYEQDILHRLDAPTRVHWLGTDAFGRDVLARLVPASRNSLTIALMGILRNMGADTVIVTGCSTSGCVRATIATGADLGYRIVVPEECVAERSKEAHAYNLFDLRARYADVLPLEQVIAAVERATPPNYHVGRTPRG